MNSNDLNPENDFIGTESEPAADRAVDLVDQLLVAYLDGELNDDDTKDIETRLASEPELRQRLHELQATWDMLDELPRTEPNQAFLRSTIEMLVTTSETRKRRWHRWPLRIAALVAAFILASVPAFQVVRSLQTAPHRRFVADLDFFENADMYSQVQEFDFLVQLREQGVFSESIEAFDAGLTGLSNLDRYENLASEELADIKSRKERFEEKPAILQERLRDIHLQLEGSSDRDELSATMRSYVEWLKNLKTPDRKASLRALPMNERVAEIRRIRLQQAEELFGVEGETQLPKDDVPILFQWVGDFFTNKNDKLVKLLEDNTRNERERRSLRRNFERIDRPEWVFYWLNRANPEIAVSLIEKVDIDQLHAKLSEDAAGILEAQTNEEDRTKLVYRWVLAAVEAKLNPTIPDRELFEFYESEMNAEEQARVDEMTPKNRRRAISRMYMSRRMQSGYGNGLSGERPGDSHRHPDRSGRRRGDESGRGDRGNNR